MEFFKKVFQYIYSFFVTEKKVPRRKRTRKSQEPKYRILMNCPFHSTEKPDEDCPYFHKSFDCNSYIKFSQCKETNCELQHSSLREEFHENFKLKLNAVGIVDDTDEFQTLSFILFETILYYQEMDEEKTNQINKLTSRINTIKEYIT